MMIDYVVSINELPYNLLSVTWNSGKHVMMDAVKIAKSWLTMSNDAFYNRYGFNYVPSQRIQKIARKELQ